MLIQKPRGTKDIYGTDRSYIEEICLVIKNVFIAYGYTEIRTPIFENINVFIHNDEVLLEANKEFFQIKNRGETEYVLRPENTASVVRALVEHKVINRQVDYPIRFFYEGPYFRYERPQSGRFRQFTQMGIEKINSNQISDDIENLLIMQEIQDKLSLKLKLKLNYIGNKETKSRGNAALREYFRPYKEELTEISQKRIEDNPLRILDDKVDSKKKFVTLAPKVENYLSQEDIDKLGHIKQLIQDIGIEVEGDSSLVRGIDYYTGLIYEGIDEEEGLTIGGGGRYDNLFERFGYLNTPSLGLAIGIERLKMILEREKRYEGKIKEKYLYLYPKHQVNAKYINGIFNLRKYISDNEYRVHCIASYEVLDIDKHRKLFKKISGEDKAVLLGGEDRDVNLEQQILEFKEIISRVYGV